MLAPLVDSLHRSDIRLLAVHNEFFGGNTGVTGLMVGADLSRVLADEPAGHRYLLPDVCLSEGRFLDGTTVEELPRPVEVVATDGRALRAALEPEHAMTDTRPTTSTEIDNNEPSRRTEPADRRDRRSPQRRQEHVVQPDHR